MGKRAGRCAMSSRNRTRGKPAAGFARAPGRVRPVGLTRVPGARLTEFLLRSVQDGRSTWNCEASQAISGGKTVWAEPG